MQVGRCRPCHDIAAEGRNGQGAWHVGRRHVLVLHGERGQMQRENCDAESEGCERVIRIWKMLLKFFEFVFVAGWWLCTLNLPTSKHGYAKVNGHASTSIETAVAHLQKWEICMPGMKKENALPSNLGQNPIRPLAHTILPRLIERKQTQAKRRWQEPIFDRNFAGRNRSLQRRNIAEDEDDDDSEDHAGEEEIVL
jgi:hypothetical protein